MKVARELVGSAVAVGVTAALLALGLRHCSNYPYRPGDAGRKTFFMSFSEAPKTLDPATAYFIHEGNIIDKICEPPLAYHYLKRPYELVPRTAVDVPVPVYFDAATNRIEEADPAADKVARVEYTVRIKPGILYQPHPCFATNAAGGPLYADLSAKDLAGIETPNDFPVKGTRELTAADYELQLRRLADPRTSCPIFATLEQAVLGMGRLKQEYSRMLDEERARRKKEGGAGFNRELAEEFKPILLDYRSVPFAGFEIVDRHTFKLILTRKYPQIRYWMAMHFLCPMPEEAVRFYSEPALVRAQITLERWPIGTGAYYLHTMQPQSLIVLERNPNYRQVLYPGEGEPGDREAGLLADAGKALPFVDRLEMHIEKEAIPQWNKFLQGYYDTAGIEAEVFDQTIRLSIQGRPDLTDDMRGRGITLTTAVQPSIFYFAFNMLDPVVGGYDERRQKLRQAIAIALDYNEYLAIFNNSRGVPAQGPIPPGIFGSSTGPEGANPYADRWDAASSSHVRKPIEEAKRLMAEAGYPEGRGPSGGPLVLCLDHHAGGEPSFDAQFQWFRRRLALVGVELRERGTDLSRFREKIDKGNWQVMRLGWMADYPDPENFLFLFYGRNASVAGMGENKSNYSNAVYDACFRQMESMEDGPQRLEVIGRMVDTLRRDAPWVWGYHPVGFGLSHEWVRNVKPHQMDLDTIKYVRLEPELRERRQAAWNKPRVAPVVRLFLLVALAVVPGALLIRARREEGR